MKCDFIGIGVQKSASTWVHRILQDHPEVAVSDPKELDFFSFNYDKGLDWYEEHFCLKKDNTTIVGEISPSYFNSHEAIMRAKQYNPDLKIVVTLRDPVARAYSNHLHLIRIGEYKGEDLRFETGLCTHSEYVEQSRYYSHLKLWFKQFPRQQFLVLVQEDIQENPEQSAKKLYEFLDINSQHQSAYLTRRANVSYAEKYKGFDKVLQMVGFVFRKAGMPGFIQQIRDSSIVIKLREKNRVHLNTVVPKIGPETEESLMKELSGEMLALADLLQVESLPWKTWTYLNAKKIESL